MVLLAQMRVPGSPLEWVMWGGMFFVVVILIGALLAWTIRRSLSHSPPPTPSDELTWKAPSAADPAFAAASMQAVIQRLRAQEKELELLHRAEKERAQHTERLSEAVTRDMPTGLLLINAAGLINLANPAAKNTLGIEALAYRRYSEALGGDSQITRLIEDCLTNAGTFQREELDHRTPAGVTRRLGVTISPIYQSPRDTNARVTGAVCLLTDLTQMVELQNQVRLKENLAALGEMAAGIAHEFKNALATISGYAQLIRDDPRGSDTAESAQGIMKQTQALSHVVTEFLRFSRPLDVSVSEVDVRGLLEQVRDEAARSHPSVTFQVSGHFETCPGDEGLLRQVFLNLVRNAAEAMAGGATAREVSIEGEVTEGPSRRQRIAVRDRGPGIPAADLSKIFLPFYTTKADGTGLGLALVQKIVIHHGGSVEAHNRAEGGAEFIVSLPLRAE